MEKRLTVKQTAEMLGVAEMTIRIGLQQGAFPFGVAIKRKPENKRYGYYIYADKVREFLGASDEEIQN